MGFESTISIYKFYNKTAIDNDLLTKITSNYERDHNSYYGDNKKIFTMPEVISRDYNVNVYDSTNHTWNTDTSVWDESNVDCIRDRYYIADKHGNTYRKADLIIDYNFISNFSALYEHFHMNGIDNIITISESNAKMILAAVKYLLNGKFDPTIEEIMSNEYITAFGDEYPAYRWKTPNKDIYIEKVDKHQYKISMGDKYSDAELDEISESYRYVLNRVKSAMETFLDLCQSNYNRDIDYVMTYSASY